MEFYQAYLPVLIFIAIAFGLSLLMIFVSWLRSKRHAYYEKDVPYECGFDAFDTNENNARHRFEIHFYLVSILFIIFDLEIALLFPWAVTFKTLDMFGFYSMMIFLHVLAIGFIYEWRKGALDWK